MPVTRSLVPNRGAPYNRRTDGATRSGFMQPETAKRLHDKVRQLCARGYRDYDAGRYQAALRSFYQAWLALPKPQNQWPAAGWVLTAIGDAYFRLERWEPGAEALRSALHCPEADSAPFPHLRLGQCLWQLGREAEARRSLFRACQIGGTALLDREDALYRQAIADLLPAS